MRSKQLTNPLLRVLSCAVFFVVSCSGRSTPKTWQTSEKDTNEFIHHYYEHPDRDRLYEIFLWCNRNGLLTDPSKSGSVTGLFGGLLNRNPSFIKEYVELGKQVQLHNEQTTALSMALWICGSSECRDALSSNPFKLDASHFVETQQYDPKPLSELPITEPAALDILWGWFIATGDMDPVKRIIQYVSEYETKRGVKVGMDTVPMDFTAESGRWSLISQASNHEKVFQALSECAKFQESCRGLLHDADLRRVSKKLPSSAQ